MAASTLTVETHSALPADHPGSSFSNVLDGRNEHSRSPNHWHVSDQEAIQMNTIGEKAPSVSSNDAAAIPSWTMSTKDEWIAIAACCLCLFNAGWMDATTGPLLPTIQAYYKINFVVVSMLFVSNFVGFMSAAVINIHLTDKLGFGKVILLGSLLQVAAYSLLVPALPFPLMCILYATNGFGNALQNAQANGFISELPKNASAKMGLLHATYGAGAFIVPLVATQFAQIPRWSFHYLTSLGVSLSNATALYLVFRLKTQEEILGTRSHHEPPGPAASQQNKYKEIFSSRAVQLLAFFAWVYVGVEVTVGGWIVTPKFVIEERGGGPSAGYISSGFFGGLMLGRVVLLWVGERRAVHLYCILAIGLELAVWLVPSLIGNAVAVSLVGLLLGGKFDVKIRHNADGTIGPMYPIAMNLTKALVPRRILTGSIGWIASFGQAGSAVFPFIAGVLAQKEGVKALQPLLVGMLAALIILWAFVPGKQKHHD